MRRITYILMAAAVMVACQRSFTTETYSDEMSMPSCEGSSDSLLFSLSLEYVSGGLEPSVTSAINSTLTARAFDLEESTESIEEAAVRYRDNLIDEYLTESSPSTWEDRLEGRFTGQYRKWKNYLLTYYTSRGGVHGIQTISPITFELSSGRAISQQDIFADGFEEPVTALLRDAVSASLEGDLLSLVEMDLVRPNDNFSVDDNGIHWYFQPYEVGPYALGIVSVCLSWKELQPYLK